jgi:hypothetical protein
MRAVDIRKYKILKKEIKPKTKGKTPTVHVHTTHNERFNTIPVKTSHQSLNYIEPENVEFTKRTLIKKKHYRHHVS